MASDAMPPTNAKQPETSLAQYNKRLLWRLGAWGGAATISLAAVVIVSQTASGHKRLQVALTGPQQPAGVIEPTVDHDMVGSVVDLTVAKLAAVERNTAATRAETKRLSSQVSKLSADSFRFTGRLSNLEHQIDGITGSIKQHAEEAAAAAVAKAMPPKPAYDKAFDMNAPVISPPATTFPRLSLIIPPTTDSTSPAAPADAAKSMQVAVRDVATTSALKAATKDEPKIESKTESKTESKADSKTESMTEPVTDSKVESKAEPHSEPKAQPKAEPKSGMSEKSEAKAAPMMAPKTELKAAVEAKPAATGMPRPGELKAEVGVEPTAVPKPKQQIANSPASKPERKMAHHDTGTKVASTSAPARKRRSSSRQSYGVDIGGADTVTIVKAQWAAVKANFGSMLAGMRPTAVRDHRLLTNGSYRLVVGRLHSLSAAERLCARFARQQVSCEPIEFDGERVVWR